MTLMVKDPSPKHICHPPRRSGLLSLRANFMIKQHLSMLTPSSHTTIQIKLDQARRSTL
jgi:hypothetical protein